MNSGNVHYYPFFVIVARLLTSLLKGELKFQQMELVTTQSSHIRMYSRR